MARGGVRLRAGCKPGSTKAEGLPIKVVRVFVEIILFGNIPILQEGKKAGILLAIITILLTNSENLTSLSLQSC